jgi:hypothetical protein
MRVPISTVGSLAFLIATSPVVAQSVAPFNAAAWREDVRVIARELPARHPDAFFRVSHERWDSAVAATEQGIAGMTRNQALVALMQLVALVQDGHTSIQPLFDAEAAVRYYPVEFYRFDDGLFIRSAAPEHRDLAGARVLRIGRASADEALAAAARILPHENDWWATRVAPNLLGLAELLDGMGLVSDMESLPLVVERNGRRDTVSVRPAGRLAGGGHGPNGPIDRTGWVDMRETGTAPLWLQQPGRPYWSRYEPDDRTLYVAYRGVVSLPPPESNAEFWRSVFALADSLPLARLVLDIRENTGGNSFHNRQVVRGIVARPQLDRADKLFVIAGGRTFSAAMNLARDLEQWTNATFVGEPTGNAAYFFGDHVQVRLPASGLVLNVSTLTWPPYDPRDRRDFLAPAIYAPLTSAEYRANIDPAIRAIREAATTPSLAQSLEAAVMRGDTLAGARLIAEARAAVTNRFRTPEAEVNALGYRLLNAHHRPEAIAVFRLNAGAFPASANVWDSLGEALLVDGQRDAAIAAYRHALDIEPDYPPSVEALRRISHGGITP